MILIKQDNTRAKYPALALSIPYVLYFSRADSIDLGGGRSKLQEKAEAASFKENLPTLTSGIYCSLRAAALPRAAPSPLGISTSPRDCGRLCWVASPPAPDSLPTLLLPTNFTYQLSYLTLPFLTLGR